MSRGGAERASVTSETRTLPPPNGEKDIYGAPTRVGTLPENVLAAMRDRQVPDEHVIATRYVRPFVPPAALPASPSAETTTAVTARSFAPEPIPPPAAWTSLPPLPVASTTVATVPPSGRVRKRGARSRLALLPWLLLAVFALVVLGGSVYVVLLGR